MKTAFLFYAVLILLLSACQNNAPATTTSTEPITSTDKIFYLEWVTTSSTTDYDKTQALVQKALLDNGYIFDKRVKKVDGSERPTQIIHRFKEMSAYNIDQAEAEKIVLTLNAPIEGHIHKFNYRSYQKQGHADWQSVFNPGNFRYPQEQPFEVDKFANWMVERIVLLTYKSHPESIGK